MPLADYLARVDPDVAKELHDNLRLRDGGLTVEETRGLQSKEVIADPLQLVRGSGGLEPQFSLGDRKVTLQRMGGEVPKEGQYGFGTSFHDFDLLDETGKKIGSLNLSEQKGGKQIYVEMIQAGGTPKMYDPNFLGPSIIRDLGRQIKAEFPKAFGPDGLGITGHRVTGAREKAGTWEAKSAMPVIKFSQTPEGWGHVDAGPTLRELFAEIGGQTIETKRAGDLHYSPELEPHKVELDKAIREELGRIAPKLKDIFTPDQIGVPGRPNLVRRGFLQQFREQAPWVVVALDNPNAMGVARHEGMHFLRQLGFFRENEWGTLERASQQNDWKTKFDVEERYKGLHEEGKMEESIVEAYQTWKGAKDKDLYPPGIARIFQRLEEFFNALRTRVKEITGKDLSWDEIFQKVDTGEVGGRKGTGPLKEGAFRPQAMDEPIEGIFEKGKAMGVTQAHMDRMLNLIAKRNAEDLVKATARAEKQQKRSQTAEWKQRRTDLRDEVREQLASRPDLATDELFAKGVIKLHPDYLSEDQKASLPKDYIQKKDGVNPDDLAPYFGYTSGDALVERLGMLTTDRRSAGMSQRDYFNRLVDVETDRRLNAEFGDLGQSIMDAAKDQALSETQLDLIHEETLAYALAAGQEPKFTKEQVREMVKGQFDQTPVGQINSSRIIQTAGKNGRKIEEASSKGDWAEAYRISQQREFATIAAKMARDYERRRDLVDRIAKTYRRTPDSDTAKRIDTGYYNYIQQSIMRLGYGIQRSVQNLDAAIALEGYDSLADFVSDKRAAMRELNVPDFMLDPKWTKPINELTHAEFGEVERMLKTMQFEGRDEKKIEIGGEKHDLAITRNAMIQQVKDIASLPAQTRQVDRPSKVKELAKSLWWQHVIPEYMWDRLDRGDKRGLFTRVLTNPAAEAINREVNLMDEFRKKLTQISNPPDMDKVVDNTVFKDPNTGEFIPMRRRNLLGVLQYWGNPSNIAKLTEGWGVEPQAVLDLLRRNTTKEDWDRAQTIGDHFEDLFNRAERMSHQTTGVGIDRVRLETFTDPHGVERRGWYSPVDYDQYLPGKSKAMLGENALERDGYYRATPAQGYTKGRTKYTAPTALDLDIVPIRMGQMIHDIAVRPAIIQMSKIIYDKDFQRAIIAHYGKAPMDEMKSFVQDLANRRNFDSPGQQGFNQVIEYLRRNTVGTLIGWNPSTIMKHTPTAALSSISEVGAKAFAKEFFTLNRTDPHTGMSKLKAAYDESEEIQGRLHNYADLLRGQGDSLKFEQGTLSWLRELQLKLSALPVSVGDFASTVPTYLAERNKALAAGLPIGDAIELGNRAVRMAHGTSRLTGQPGIMRTNSLGRTYSSLYGFFSHILQKQYKLAWQARDLINDQKPLDIEGHWAPHMLGKFMSYVIGPAIIEELVTPYTNEERDSWGVKAAKSLALGLSSSMIGVRDLVRGLINPGQPASGLLGTAFQFPGQVAGDLAKRGPLNKEHAGKLIKDTVALTGVLTGLTNAQTGRSAEYIYRYAKGLERPKGPWDTAVGLRYGTTEKHEHTFADWWKHTVEGKK